MTLDNELESIDEEIYLEYKLIIKELLFNGADRNIRTKEGLSALEIVNQHAEVFT